MTSAVLRRASALTAAVALCLAALAAAPASAASTESEPPAYFPYGPQRGVDQSEVVGWEVCYSGLMAEYEIPLYGEGGILDELCTGDYLMLAGGEVGSTELILLAAAAREDALVDTGVNPDATHLANGSEWYFNSDVSWGFAAEGDQVEKYTCDIAGDNSEYRLCFHLMEEYLDSGYRIGDIVNLNREEPGALEYVRYVYQPGGDWSTPAAPQLAETGADFSVLLIAAGGMLALGLATLAVSTRRRRSA